MAELQDDIELGELETVDQKIEQQEAQKTEQPEVPERYRGKSVAEIAKMHADTEKILTRQGQELGEVRKLADELLKSQLLSKAEKEKPKEVDFFDNPQEAIRLAVEANPTLVSVKNDAEQARKQLALQTLTQKHPDFPVLVADPSFQEWVGKSQMRMEMFKRGESYDVNAADELFSTYKQLKAVKQEAEVKVDKTAQKKAINDVSVDVGGSGETTKKVYRRADLIRLKMRDPDKYEALADSGELARAYAENRVR